MTKEEYGDKYNDHLLEEYKVLAQSLEAIGERRIDFNKFYLTLLSGLLAIVSIIIDKSQFSEIHNFVFLLISILGIVLCRLWQLSIRSFERISASRYTVLGEMEKELPVLSFSKSWEHLQKDNKYIVIAKINLHTSYWIYVPFFLLFVYALFRLLW